jgi:hypothetical protein
LRATLRNEQGYVSTRTLEQGSLLAATPQSVTVCSSVFSTLFFDEIALLLNTPFCRWKDVSLVSFGRSLDSADEQALHAYSMFGGRNLDISFFLEALQGNAEAQERMFRMMLESLIYEVSVRYRCSEAEAKRYIACSLWHASEKSFRNLLVCFYNEKRRVEQLDVSDALPHMQQ